MQIMDQNFSLFSNLSLTHLHNKITTILAYNQYQKSDLMTWPLFFTCRSVCTFRSFYQSLVYFSNKLTVKIAFKTNKICPQSTNCKIQVQPQFCDHLQTKKLHTIPIEIQSWVCILRNQLPS